MKNEQNDPTDDNAVESGINTLIDIWGIDKVKAALERMED